VLDYTLFDKLFTEQFEACVTHPMHPCIHSAERHQLECTRHRVELFHFVLFATVLRLVTVTILKPISRRGRGGQSIGRCRLVQTFDYCSRCPIIGSPPEVFFRPTIYRQKSAPPGSLRGKTDFTGKLLAGGDFSGGTIL